MSNPMEQSLQGTSEFVAFDSSMDQSMCGESEKIPLPNASLLNRQERERDQRAYQELYNKKIDEEIEEQEQNEFLNVGKWSKQKAATVADPVLAEKPQIKKERPPPQVKANISTASHTSSELDKKGATGISKWNKSKETHQPQTQPHFMNPIHHVKPEIAAKPKEEEQDEDEEEDEEEQEEQEEEEESEEQSQEQQEEQEQDQQDEEEGSSEQGWDEEGEPQIEEEEEEEIQDKFADGVQDHYDDETEHRTETVNTSALNRTPEPAKWGKKAPLETKTKYEVKSKQEDISEKQQERLNSASFTKHKEADYIDEELPADEAEWGRVEGILLRLKKMLA